MQRLAAVLDRRHVPQNPAPTGRGADADPEPLPQELHRNLPQLQQLQILPQMHHLRAQQDRQLQVSQAEHTTPFQPAWLVRLYDHQCRLSASSACL